MTTEHFVVDTDLDADEARVMVRQLENLRHVMAEVTFGGEPAPAARVRVLALRQDEYAHFGHQAAGVFVDWTLFQPMLVTSPGGDWATFSSNVRKHELAHYVSSLYVDMRLQPRWFAEGTATYLETLRYDEQTGAIEIGHHPDGYEYLDYMKPVTVQELWDWGESTPYEELRHRLYATSWAAVHYLFDKRPADIVEFERALARGEEARKAWNQIFPDLDDTGLADAIRKYIHKRDNKIAKATIPPIEVTAQTRPLSEADVLGLRAELYMALQGASKRTLDETKRLAKTTIDASLAVDPASFWAHQVNLFYFDIAPSSLELARKTIANQQENWLAWLWYAEVLRRAKGPLDEQRSALSKSLDLAPGNPVALTQLAWVEARAGHWKSALAVAARAVRRPPVQSDSLVAYAAALSRTGQCDDARVVEQAVQKRMGSKMPHDVSQLFIENHQACDESASESRGNGP
jgi:hypothetical protein